LCCQFVGEPVRFRTLTAAGLGKYPRARQLERIAEVCLHNADALLASLRICAREGIGSFRIISSILPLVTHPEVGYDVEELPGADDIVARFRAAGELAAATGIRTGFHPDQFIVLNSPDDVIVQRSIADLESQARVAEWTHADTINIHGGGAYGDKTAALARLRRNLERLSPRVRSRLTVENDDSIYTPADLHPVCVADRIPLVYDVHHHRCHPDGWTVAEATAAARATWTREPLFHLSSPLEGWDGPKPERHHDFVDVRDFPAAWLGWPLTVEVEAKAKELAVVRLRDQLHHAA
jgi:UV DNA damage endonuclease